MRICFLSTLISLCLISNLRAQDLITIKNPETIISCRIKEVSDTLITYFPESNPKLLQWVRRQEVLSFVINTHPPKGKKKKRKTLSDPREGLWGVYHSGEEMDGYLITSKGDTISGLLRITNPALNQMRIDFKHSDGKNVVYKVEDTAVTAYGYGSLHYRKVRTRFTKEVTNGVASPSGLLFLHLVVDGPARLYHFNTVSYPNHLLRGGNGVPPLYYAHIESHYLMVNPSDKMILTRNRSIKGAINRLLNDHKVLMERIRLKGFRKSEVISIFDEYNEWYRKAKLPSNN